MDINIFTDGSTPLVNIIIFFILIACSLAYYSVLHLISNPSHIWLACIYTLISLPLTEPVVRLVVIIPGLIYFGLNAEEVVDVGFLSQSYLFTRPYMTSLWCVCTLLFWSGLFINWYTTSDLYVPIFYIQLYYLYLAGLHLYLVCERYITQRSNVLATKTYIYV